MELKARLLKWSAGIPVAIVNSHTAEKLGIHENDRISIKDLSRDGKEFSTVVNIVEKIVKTNEIGISYEAENIFNLKKGKKVEVHLAKYPLSLKFINKKVQNQKLSKKEIEEIVKDISNNSLSEPEIALFIFGMYENEMNFNETINLINAFLKYGNQISFDGNRVVDKHCIGGVPGNRTTPIVVAICAAAGLIFPKTSSRAITSAAGTADVIEAVAKIEFPLKKLKQIVKKTGACMVWGGSIGLVPTDSRIIRIEKMLKIDSRSQMIASIMSKKLAMGSKHLLIDIPYGKGAKVSKKEGLRLKKDFEKVGKHFKLNVKVVLTDGTKPIGKGIGPKLELRDIVDILNPFEEGPKDLEKKSLFLASQILEMTKTAKKGEGLMHAKEILYSGKALEKFLEIIRAQEGSIKDLKLDKYKKEILASFSGKILEIDNKKINSLARIAGCPRDKSSGLYLHFNKGQKIKKGEKLLTIYSKSKPRLKEALIYYNREKPIRIIKR